MAEGWAVTTSNGDIEVSTVSPTRRAAIVNWLVVACSIMIRNSHSDADIEEIWRKNRTFSRKLPGDEHRSIISVDVVEVSIERKV